MRLALAGLLLLGGPDELLRELDELRQKVRGNLAKARELRASAHEALDLDDYDAAVRRHKEARDLERRAADLKKREEPLLRKIVPLLIPLLDDADIEVRERASSRLLALGPAAIPLLEDVGDDLGIEVKTRIADALAKLRLATLDQEGRVRQWASSARASSEYSATNWSALQATGKPDTLQAGDHRTAWASLRADTGEEWLELSYDVAVLPTHVRIHETYNPGAVVRIDAQDAEGTWHVLWAGQDSTRDCPAWFTVAFRRPAFAAKSIRVTIDSLAVAGWNEIDAVELIGNPAP